MMIPFQIWTLKYIRRTKVLNPWAKTPFKSKPTWRAHNIKYRRRNRLVSTERPPLVIKYRPGKTQRDMPEADVQRAWDALCARDLAKVERAEIARQRRQIEGSWA